MSELKQARLLSFGQLRNLYASPREKSKSKAKKSKEPKINSDLSLSYIELADDFTHNFQQFTGLEDFQKSFKIDFRKNTCLHCMLFNSVNPLDFLKYFIGFGVQECSINTWNFNDENLLLLNNIVERKKIEKFNFFLSDTILKKYPKVYKYLKEVPFYGKSKVIFYKTHSKIMLIEFKNGYKLSFLSSMSLNTANHIEQATLIFNDVIYDYFYDRLNKYETLKDD